jgi:hypothetical protein
VGALTVYNGDLIAGGGFTTAGGTPANKIARWNGSTWAPLGSGVSGGLSKVHALAVYNGELIAGGNFTIAGEHVSAFWARWGRPCPGDFNADGVVDLADLGVLLADFGCTAGPGNCPGDTNCDGDTDLADLGILLAEFGNACP